MINNSVSYYPNHHFKNTKKMPTTSLGQYPLDGTEKNSENPTLV